MSDKEKTVDDRVLSMEFDNSKFEKNVNQSIGTLDRLKKSLNMDSAVKGFDSLDKATQKVSFDGLTSGVESVKKHFSAMEIVGITAISNITSAAMQAGTNIVKSLSIDQVKAGYEEFELEIGSIQTIMAGTGASLETVNGYLQELNTYADKTIYTFSDMTSSIGKFTNAGVDLDKAVSAIKGISNEAAVSGANAQEASRAMYNFAQALSAGYVKLIDWKSIENANMATKEFKQQLIDTAVQLGTLQDAGNGMYRTLEKGTEMNSVKNFNDTLQEQWMTTDVLVKTLEMYADETTDIGAKATEAATKVRKFSQLMDTLKEAVGSGWSRTFKTIIGDFNESTELFTGISNVVGGFIDKLSDRRIDFFTESMSSGYKQMLRQIENAGLDITDFSDKLVEVGKAHGVLTDEMIEDAGSIEATMKSKWLTPEIFRETIESFVGGTEAVANSTGLVTDNLEQFGAIVDKVCKGAFGNGAERMQKLQEAGYDYATIQSLVNSKITGVAVNTENLTETINSLSDEQLKATGYTEEQVKALRELAKQSTETGTPINELLKDMDKVSGRELVIESFKNIFGGLKIVLDAAKTSWTEFFDGVKSSDFYSILERINKATNEFKDNLENLKTQEKLTKSFKGLFAVLDLGARAIKFTLGNALKLLSALLGGAGGDVLGVSSSIGDLLVRLHDWILAHNDVSKGITKVVDKIAEAIKVSKNWLRNHIDVEKALKTVCSALKGFGQLVKEVVEDLGIVDKIQSKTAEGVVFFANAVEKLKNNSAGSENGLKKFITSLTEIRNSSRGVDTLVRVWKSFKANVLDEIFGKGKEAVKSFSDGINEFVQNGADMAESLGDKFVGLKDKVIESTEKIKETLGGDFVSQALAAGISATIMVIAYKIAKLLGAVQSSIFDFSVGISGVLSGVKKVLVGFATDLKAKALVEIAKAILILVGALVALTLLAKYDWDSMKKGAAVLGGLVVAVTAVIGVLTLLAKRGGTITTMSSAALIISLAASIGILVIALKSLNGLNIKYMGDELAALGIMIVGLIGAIKLISFAVKDAPQCAIELLAMAVAIRILVKAIEDLSELDLSNMKKENWSALIGCVALMGGLMLACSFAGKNAAMGGAAMLAVAVALKTLCSALKDFMELDLSGMSARHIAMLSGIMVGITVLMIATGKAGQYAVKASAALLLDIVAMHMLLSLLKKIQEMNSIDLQKTLGTLGILSGIVTALLTVYHVMGKGTGKAGLLLLSLGASLISLSVAVVMLGKLDTNSLIKGVGAITTIMGMMTFMTTKMATVKGSWEVITALTACIGALSLGVAALSFIPADKLLGATAALSALMLSLGLLVKFSKNAYASIKTLAVMTAVVLALGGIVIALTKLNPDGAIQSATSMSMLLIAMSSSIVILNGAKALSWKTVGQLGVMLAIVTGLGVIITAMSAIGNPDNAIKMATSLSELILAMSAACVALEVAGLVSGAALSGLVALGALVAGLVAVSLTLGSINDKIPQFEQFLDSGIPILEKIATAIGTVFGNLVGGFASGVISGLPMIGASLSAFMIAIQPFLALSKKIDKNSTEGAGEIVKSILALTATNLLEGLSRWFGLGKSGLESFPEKAKALGEGVVAFSEAIKDKDINTANIKLAAQAGALIAEMASKIPNSGGLAGIIMGENEADEFGKRLGAFADGIITFSDKVSNATINVEAIQTASQAGSLIADMASKLPNSGGWAGKIAGENDIDVFASKMGPFADGLAIFSDTVSLRPINLEAVENATKAGVLIAKMANEIPNSGLSVASVFVGDNDLGAFGKKLKAFGEAIADFSEAITAKGVNLDAVSKACEAMKILSAAIPEDGGLWSALTSGSKNMTAFGNELKSFGEAISVFSKKIKNVDANQLSLICYSISDIADAFDKAGGKTHSSLTNLLGGFVDTITSTKDDFKKGGKQLVQAMVEGMNDASDIAAMKFQKILDDIAGMATTEQDKFYDAGKNVVDGFAKGINENAKTVKDASSNLASQNVVDIINKKLDIHSPSRVAKKQGQFFDLGFANGISGFSKHVTDAVSGVADDSIDGLRYAIARVADTIQNGVDNTPVIRPVMDLSDIRSGVSAISGMFGDRYELATNVGSISAMMNTKPIYATNDDVVSAIGKLRKDIANIQGNTYNVNGVTYDDGSNVSTAVESLIHAVTIERRA